MSRTWQVLSAAASVCLLLAGCAVAVALSEEIPDAGYLTRDATAVAGVSSWSGALSRVTNLCWAVAASVNVMAALSSRQRWRPTLMLLGGLCSVLALDDTLLIHETAANRLGVNELLLLSVYGVAALALAWLFRSSWRTGAGAAFFGGATMLGLSLAVDALGGDRFLLEDGAKLLGIVAWCFCGVWAHSDLSAHGRAAGPRSDSHSSADAPA